ncbi:MAG: hypothetical protein HUU49_01370 [Candidatus Buchananbacteria bacterium]|nr:hypothetical protein [Candidatus Buchananbacteria bacterium]
MNKIKILYYLLAIAFGVFMIIFGGFDDSPGAQLIGLIVIITVIAVAIKNRKKTHK